MNNDVLIYLIAGEPSGDLLGAALMRALKQENPHCKIVGVGGVEMEKEGLNSLFPIKNISHMGFSEVLPHLFTILKAIKKTQEDILEKKPDAIVTIDSPGFSFRVIKKITNIPLIHYVAPSVWAWRPKRAIKIAQLIDHLLVLFPFEPPYFEEHNLPVTFLGHPLVEKTPPLWDDSWLLKENIKPYQKIITLLPGSRETEVKKLWPLYLKVAKKLFSKNQNFVFYVPTLPHLKELITYPPHLPIVIKTEEKQVIFAHSELAIAASGTVTLELAQALVPTIVTYKTSFLTYYLAKKLIKISYICLVNILNNKEIFPEKIQGHCNEKEILKEVTHLLKKKETHKKALKNTLKMLENLEKLPPSILAAQKILTLARIKK